MATQFQFLETPRFPDDIGMNAKSIPMYSTSIIELKSGHERRNINWQYPRHRYNIAYGVKDAATMDQLLEFFHTVAGRAVGFRFKDYNDYRSGPSSAGTTPLDQSLGQSDGITTTLQLKKSYGTGNLKQERIITKPVADTIQIAVGRTTLPTDSWSVDTTTGIITFDTPPTRNRDITWGGEFDVPVRFENDSLEIDLRTHQLRDTDVMLIETKDYK